MLVNPHRIKFLVIYILLFLGSAACHEQEVVPEAQVLPENTKELESLLNTDINDEVRLEVFWELFKKVQDEEPKLALGYLESQASLSTKIGNNQYLGKAYFGQALMSKRSNEYVQAVDFYLASINAFEQINDVGSIASALSNLGDIFATTGNYEYAEKFFKRAYQTHLKTGDKTRQVLTSLNLGICNFSKQEPDYVTSNQYFQKALELTGSLDQKQDYYFNRIYNQLGTVKYKQADYSAAIHNYQLSLEYLGAGDGIEEKQAIAYANIGEAYMDQGNYTEAQRWMDKSFALSSHIRDNQVAVDVHNMMARLYQVQGEHEQAVIYLEKAIEVADKDVINEALQETIELTRLSYKFLQNSGKPVSVARYEKALTVDGMQDALEEELVEKANFTSLQSALGLSIELDNQIKEKKAEIEQRELISNIALSLGILLIIAAIVGFIYTVNYIRTKRSRDEWRDVCLEVRNVLESIPQ